MKTVILSASLLITLVDIASAERLDRRFGDDRERGYRSEREFESRAPGFSNRDRANFLGAKSAVQVKPELPKQDLQAPATIGQQR